MSDNITFTKAHGTGNDFIIFIAEESPDLVRDRSFISRLCRRRTGVGADAVLVLSKEPGYDYKMDYYNSDGTWETMCANGARCAGLLMKKRSQVTSNQIHFLAGDGPHEMEILEDDQIRLKMTPPEYKSDMLTVEGFSGCHVDSGATHFTTEVERFTMKQASEFAPGIRYASEFAPRGINVDFFEVVNSRTIKVITYEKGIEKVMLSCGSGSVAAAFHAAKLKELESPLDIIVPGGKLSLVFDSDWQNVWLSGPAVILYTSQINPDNLH
ncbi:MAG: diaminopimelate epimerase [Candidatus Marinimicrobia bacterium]|nr:diaminopimelate epimerase [Candidatus Neomarinimicrobiota bacterium]